MKVSIRTGFDPNDPINPLDGALKQAKDMGFDGIELCLSPRNRLSIARFGGPWSSESVTPAMREEFRKSAQKYGCEIATLSADWAWTYCEVNPRISQWLGRGLELLKADINLAGDLGAKAILFHVGSSTGTWDEMKAFCSAAGEEGARRGVKVAYEGSLFPLTGLNGWRGGIATQEDLCRMVDDYSNPFLGVYIHPDYPRRPEQPHEEVLSVGRRLAGIHSGSINVQVDYQKYFQAIKDVGYDGYWVFEVGMDRAASDLGQFRYLIGRYW